MNDDNFKLVYRLRPLPTGDLRGTFILCESIISATDEALARFRLAGIQDGGHEGIVFWAGRELGNCQVFTTVIIPEADHSYARVVLNERAVGASSRAARKHSLQVLCQVHSHPSTIVHHSDGDDDLITMPYEGMLSIVVASHGLNFNDIYETGIHQYQDGRWVLCTSDSVKSNIKVVPIHMDLTEHELPRVL